MEDIKKLLKQARKLIDEKEFKEAQECCKNILRKDKQNYLALILLGKSLQDTEQAPLAFQKAISCQSDNPLAWYGLANHYERQENNESKDKLIAVYDKILQLKLEDQKYLEIVEKLTQIGLTTQTSLCVSILCKFIELSLIQDVNIKTLVIQQLIKLLSLSTTCKENDYDSIVNILMEYSKNRGNSNTGIILTKIMLQNNKIEETINKINKHDYLIQNKSVCELVCEELCKKYIETNTFGGAEIASDMDVLINNIKESVWSKLFQNIILYQNGMHLEAYKNSIPLIRENQLNITVALFILKCLNALEKWTVIENLGYNFITKTENNTYLLEMKKILFKALMKQEKWRKASEIVKAFDMKNLELEDKASVAECFINVDKDVNQILQSLKNSEFFVPLWALHLLKKQEYNNVIEFLNNTNDRSAICLLYLGQAYWHLGDYEKSLLNLLQSAKLDSKNGLTFLSLGQYYHYHVKDLEKAKKCYEKANNLNNYNLDIIKKLSEIYTVLKLYNNAVELLSYTEKTLACKEDWVYFKLGLCYINIRQWENAIDNLRLVIKYNQKNIPALECLADAYFFRGSYTSALRAYNKIMTIDIGRSSHCCTRMGSIYSLLTQYDDALDCLQKALNSNPKSLLALKGLSEVWMNIAIKKYEAKLFGSSRVCVQEAIVHIFMALDLNKNYTCLWKQLGDSLMFATKLPNQYSYITMKDLTADTQINLQVNKIDLFPQIIACYSQVAKKDKSIAYDLASSYFLWYKKSKVLVHCNTSYNIVLQCIKMNPNAWQNWNLLGKIFYHVKKYDLSQHCFIKSLETTRKWSVAKIWSNLGILYLRMKLFKLSNYCFWRGQSALPSHAESWVGQGLIAESIRENEAMDLFRHASRLGFHKETALGYTDWVCRTLKINFNRESKGLNYIIEGLHAIPYSIDLLEWFCTFEPENACALNTLGILQERYGLIKSANKSFLKAYTCTQEVNKKNLISVNLGRVNLRLENYTEAINYFKGVTEASLDSTCGLALALYKNGLYEESYSVYDAALKYLCSNNDEKTDVLVAMSGIVYKFKGHDDAKTLLFHSIQVSQQKPSVQSLFAICALGLLHSEESLSALAITELKKHEKNEKVCSDIGFLKSYILIKQNKTTNAVKCISEIIHDHPNDAMLWFCLAQYFLLFDANKAKIASACSQKALNSIDHKNNKLNPAKLLAASCIANFLAGDKVNAFKISKKAMHIYPSNSEVWATLLYCLADGKHNLKHWISQMSKYESDLGSTLAVSQWINSLKQIS